MLYLCLVTLNEWLKPIEGEKLRDLHRVGMFEEFHSTLMSSTSKTKVEFPGMTPGCPREP